MSRKRCGAKTSTGERCLSVVLLPDGRCWQHSAKTAARARAASSQGGRGGANADTVSAPVAADPATPAGRWEWLRFSLKSAAAKRSSLQQAETIARVIRECRAEQELGELAAELAELRRLADQAVQAAPRWPRRA